MEVPKDYMLDVIREHLDGKIDDTKMYLEDKIIENKKELKEDIKELSNNVKEFQIRCDIQMKFHDSKLTELEQFKYKVYAYAGAIAVFSGVAIKIIFG